MKNALIALLFFMLFTNTVTAQIPVDQYRQEILNLKTNEAIKDYWGKLLKIDQEILVKIKGIANQDSLSIDNMIRTALLFEIHGERIYFPNNIVPIMNLSHNYVGSSQIVFWSIIKKCKKVGGVIDNFGGSYPAYLLESVGLTIYNYSFFEQNSKYPTALKKLDALTNENVVENLLVAYHDQKKTYKLKEHKVVNEWHKQAFEKLLEDEGTFSFVKMSDKELYIKLSNRFQKLIPLKSDKNTTIYRIENEPFGWTYAYKKDGSLTLRDENEKTLISYTKAKQTK